MATVTLRPDGFIQHGGWVARIGTNPDSQVPADFVTATSDDLDTSYVAPPRGVMGTLVMLFSSFTPPAGAQWRWVRPSIRKSVFQREDGWLLLGGRTAVGDSLHPEVEHFWLSPTLERHYYSKLPTNPQGNSWTQSDIDTIRWRMSRTESADQDTPHIQEIYMEADYNEAPVVTVTGPATPVTTTSSPVITWTYTDPENDAQDRWLAKVFSDAQYTATGFNADTSTADWSSGTVHNADTSVKVGVPLRKGTYRAYVKASDFGSNPVRFSPWSFREFLLDPAAPPIPTGEAVSE